MSTFYILVWIAYIFYVVSRARKEGESVALLFTGIFYGAIWPIMIPFHLYTYFSGKNR